MGIYVGFSYMGFEEVLKINPKAFLVGNSPITKLSSSYTS